MKGPTRTKQIRRFEPARAQGDEILHLIRNHEAKEKAEHPLQRIMAIEDSADGVALTTTDAHLARDIAMALYRACKGELDFHYNKEDNLLRATWMR